MGKKLPVPPKDFLYTALMAQGLSPPTGTPKRKRVVEPDAGDSYHSTDLTVADPDAHTPKRKRGTKHLPDKPGTDVSEESTPSDQHNIRRKKGVRNLSNLSLRHASQKQSPKQTQFRESKFQEGSLTDKPSQEPPSVYTRVTRTDSGNLLEVEELMDDYHKDAEAIHSAASVNSNVVVVDNEKTTGSQQQGSPSQNAGFFRFGRQFTLNFHPVALWNRMWNESKEELIRQNMEEAERKARLKAEAEAQYARMKKDGLFKPQPLSTLAVNARQTVKEVSTPVDTSFAIAENSATHDNLYSASATSQGFESGSRSGSEVPESASKPSKGFPSRLHFKRPSLNDIKSGLKRFSSDLNLSALAGAGRESSSSLSPVKTDFDDSTLRRSQSRLDLKKQQKLSKRVSDLEVKLQQARKELDEALVEASPMPKLNHKYEQFKPSWTVKRPMFTPGKLPSLLSERILMAEEEARRLASETMAQPDSPNDKHVNKEDMETIKARDYQMKPRLHSIFSSNDDNTVQSKSTNNKTGQVNKIVTMDPNSIMADPQSNDNAMNRTQGDYASLDAKLKALDKNAKLAKRSTRSRKRKSGVANEDKLYKPNATEHSEDDELADKTPRKKRKSTGQRKHGNFIDTATTVEPVENHISPNNKNDQSGPQTAEKVSTEYEREGDAHGPLSEKVDSLIGSTEMGNSANLQDNSPRNSFDSQGHQLEPLIEEDEENVAMEETTTTIPLKDVPSKPTAKATPARHSRTLRPRSTSPNKHQRSADAEQSGKRKAISEAGDNPRNLRHKKSGRLEVDEEDIVMATPGVNGVPRLPQGANGSFESLLEAEKATVEVEIIAAGKQQNSRPQYQWPDDVF